MVILYVDPDGDKVLSSMFVARKSQPEPPTTTTEGSSQKVKTGVNSNSPNHEKQDEVAVLKAKVAKLESELLEIRARK